MYDSLLGVSQAMIICENISIFVHSDFYVNYFDRDFQYQYRHDQEPTRIIHLLKKCKGIICCIRLRDLMRPIEDPRPMSEIEKVVKNIAFHVKYEKVTSQEFIQSECQ